FLLFVAHHEQFVANHFGNKALLALFGFIASGNKLAFYSNLLAFGDIIFYHFNKAVLDYYRMPIGALYFLPLFVFVAVVNGKRKFGHLAAIVKGDNFRILS